MTTVTGRAKDRRGWAMVAAAAAANFISFGILFSFGLFFSPIAAEFETTTATIAPLFSGSVFFYYISSAVGGRLADRHGARPVVAFGAVAMPLGLILSSFAGSVWQLYLLYMPLTGLAVGSCYSPLIGAVGRRFVERRAMPIALLLTGLGGGSLAMPLLIRAILDRFDWRDSFRILAVLAMVLLAAAAMAAVKRPDPRSATADGGNGTVANPLAMFSSPAFRRLYISVVLVAPGFYAPLAFLNDYAIGQDISSARAAAVLATVGLGSFVSRPLFGAVTERIGPFTQYRLSHLMMLTSLSVWLFAGASFWLLALSAVIHGLGWAAWVTSAPMVLANWFGVEDLGLLVGGFYTGLGLGALLGPAISGVIIETWGYNPALIAVILTTAASVACTMVPLGTGSWHGPQVIAPQPVG